MNHVKKIVEQIAAQRKAIRRLEADLAATRDAVSTADKHGPSLNDLRLERRNLLARAMVDKQAADTKSLDAKIANTERLHAAAQQAAATAGDAIEIISAGIRLAESEVETLHGKLKDSVSVEILARHDAAQEKYLAAVAALEAGVAGMAAAERAWNYMNFQLGLGSFPAQGLAALECIRNAGLRVDWRHSRLSNPDVAAQYANGYKNHYFLPVWADPKTPGFADELVSSIFNDMRVAGVEIDTSDFIPYVKPVSEKQIKVRVMRGTIEANPAVVRNPATDQVISSEPVSFNKGDDAVLDESLARRLRATLPLPWVLIHGEDEIPKNEAPILGTRIELVDETKPRTMNAHRTLQENYSGNFQALDMTGY